MAFQVYNASAGSGKTYTLTKEYLKILLVAPANDTYKKILAITFTNKAVEEMKSRIIESLIAFTKAEVSEKTANFMQEIASEIKLDVPTIQQKSRKILKNLIHNYAAFDISTIDKFTHRIIRTFTHDLNLPTNLFVTTGITATTQTLSTGYTYYGIVHSSNVDLTLPNSTGIDGFNFIIKDESGNSGIYRIRLTPLSGLIDGNSYVDMNINYMSLTLMVRNGNWYII
jgi:hypothetical protein